MFIDQAEISIKAGNGGNGCMSFRREKYVAKGGPDGGDGGRGGHVYIQAADNIDTLVDFNGRPQWTAKNGGDGMGSNCYGNDGEDLIIKVPVGTLIYDKEFDLLLKDMNKDGVKVCFCKGGRGGRGNKSFAHSTHQTPRMTTSGRVGKARNLRMELKLIADAGMVGLPNAGKSTLVSRCSKAHPKIADYPFTTLRPVLGIVELTNHRRFVIADIPGLIEGAHKGTGLGFDFLRHIERTRTLIHIIDIFPTDNSDPVENYHKIQNELKQYSKTLAKKPMLIVANKIDLDSDNKIVEKMEKKIGKTIYPISAVSGEGIRDLIEDIWTEVQKNKSLTE